jgi:hypothetical protein
VLTGFYRYCVEEQLLEHSPAVQVRRPKVSQESTRLGLDRTELGAFLVQAGLSGGNDHALPCLLASTRCVSPRPAVPTCHLSDLALANGHRVVRIVGKGNQPALVPLAPRTARAIDAAVGERTDGPLLARTDGAGMQPALTWRTSPVMPTAPDPPLRPPPAVPALCPRPQPHLFFTTYHYRRHRRPVRQSSTVTAGVSPRSGSRGTLLCPDRVSRAARCLLSRSFSARLPSEPRGHLSMHVALQ